MGLYDSEEPGGLFGLGIMTITENFHRIGKYINLSINKSYKCVLVEVESSLAVWKLFQL